MITNAIIQFFGSIITKILNLFPDAPIIAFGNGAASGSACCAAYMISAITTIMETGGPGGTQVISGGIAGLANHTPLPLLIDLAWFGFVLGCLVAIIAAFFIIRILLMFWQQVKW